MITSHTEARDYACSVLDFLGAPRLVRERIEQLRELVNSLPDPAPDIEFVAAEGEDPSGCPF